MAKVSGSRENVKSKRARIEELMNLSYDSLEVDTRLQLIHELIPVGLLHIRDILQEEVKQLAGEKYKRDGLPGYDRWGKQWGSVYIGESKVPIQCPRVRDKKDNKEVELRSYRSLQEPCGVNDKLLLKVLHGITCRKYKECCKLIPEVFGMSASMVSSRFIEASARKLKEFKERRLEGFDIIAIIIDGKTFQEDEMIIALGITMGGKKVVLGFTQAGTENAIVCKDFLNSLVDRGLKVEEGVLCVIDGSKGIRKAVKEVFGGYVVIQRCQWHKKENVVSYLPKGGQDRFRKLLQKAYEESSYSRGTIK